MNQEQSGKDDEPASRVNSFMHALGTRLLASCGLGRLEFGCAVQLLVLADFFFGFLDSLFRRTSSSTMLSTEKLLHSIDRKKLNGQ